MARVTNKGARGGRSGRVALGKAREAGAGYLTIAELSRRAAVSRQTIHYYLAKGLLPEPLRTSKTFALYDPSCVDVIRLVKQLQAEDRLKLDEIARLLANARFDVAAVRARTPENGLPLAARVPREGQVVVPAAFEATLQEAGLTEPAADRQIGRVPDGEAWRELLWELSRAGMPIELLRESHGLVVALARQVLASLLRVLEAGPGAEPTPADVPHLHGMLTRFLHADLRRTLDGELVDLIRRSTARVLGGRQRVNLPSESFMVRQGLMAEIDRLLRAADAAPDDPTVLQDLARALQLRRDWVRLAQLAGELVARSPADAIALAQLGTALGWLGRVEESLRVLEDGIARLGHPLLKARLAQLVVWVPDAWRSVDGMLAALARRAQLFREALQQSSSTPALSRKVRVIWALDSALVWDALGQVPADAASSLQALYEELKALDVSSVSRLGQMSLADARLQVTFALYLIRQREGHPDADRLHDEIAEADPDGVIAARIARPADGPPSD
jgi:DNA-binding transcriptional MerR regulator